MIELDRTGQRIIGVLIEKQLSVPDSYPLTENALVAGCNQTSNRDPAMDLQGFQVTGALLQLHEQEVVARVEGHGRVTKYRHRLDDSLGVGNQELAVLAELLLRGPQAPGALKPRVARMGLHASPAEIEGVLSRLAQQRIVEQLAHRPRERDRRWRHLLGDGSEVEVGGGAPEAASAANAPPTSAPVALPRHDLAEVLARLAALERRVASLEAHLGVDADNDSIGS
jgi:uncharacterized protein YceH (UPF0502 family)